MPDIEHVQFQGIIKKKKDTNDGGYKIEVDIFGSELEAYLKLHKHPYTKKLLFTIFPIPDGCGSTQEVVD